MFSFSVVSLFSFFQLVVNPTGHGTLLLFPCMTETVYNAKFVDMMRDLLYSDHSDARASAAKTFADLSIISGLPEATFVPQDLLPRLIQLLEDPDVNASYQSARALVKATHESEQSRQIAVDSGVLPALVRLIGSNCSTTPVDLQHHYLTIIGTGAWLLRT